MAVPLASKAPPPAIVVVAPKHVQVVVVAAAAGSSNPNKAAPIVEGKEACSVAAIIVATAAFVVRFASSV